MRRLNIKLSVSLVVGLLVLVVGVHVIHGIQIDKNADVLLREAERLQADGGDKSLHRAVKKYGQYLKHRPNDVSAQAKFALLAAHLADLPGASQDEMKLAYRALDVAAKHPELTDVRRRIIDYYMRLGRFVDAIEYLEKLRAAAQESGTREPALDVKYARCQVVVGHETTAIKVLDELVGFDEKTKTFDIDGAAAPNEIDAYLVLAEVLRRRRDDPERADEVMQQLVVANPDSSNAHLRLGRYDLRQARYDQAMTEFNRALELAPEDPDVILEVADIEITRRNFERAQPLLEAAVKQHPKIGEIYRAMGALALAQGMADPTIQKEKFDEAIGHVLAGLEQAPNSPTLMVFLVDLQLLKHDLDGVRDAIERMRTARFTPEFVDFYEATLAVEQRKWPQATRQLERLRPLMARWPDRVTQIDLQLGTCYENLAQPDRQKEAFRRVLDVDPKSTRARLGHSRALVALGERREGTEELQKVDRELRARKIVSPQVRGDMLRSRIAEQMQKPSDEREWGDVEALVEEMLADNDMSEVQKGLLTVELAAFKGDLDEADSLLTALLKDHPEEVRLWMSWFSIQERIAGKKRVNTEKLTAAERQEMIHEAVDELLGHVTEAEKAAGDQVSFRVVRAAAYARLGGDEAKQKLAALEEGIDKFTPDEQATLWEGLGNAYQRLSTGSSGKKPSHDDYLAVRRCFQKLVDRHPDDLYPWENMFDLAVMYRETKAALEACEQIRKVTGGIGSPSYKYCTASLLIEQVVDGKEPMSRLDEARKLVDEALRVRPEWHQLHRLAGEIDDLQGHVDAAIANYQRAQELGSTNIPIAHRLVLLLYRQGRMAEVQAALKHVGRGNSNPLLDKIDIESKFRTGDQEAALKLAKESVAANPDDDNAHVFYGQLLDAEKATEEAAQEYRAALKIKPDSQKVWLLLISNLVKADNQAEAQSDKQADPKADTKPESKTAKKSTKNADKTVDKNAGKNAGKNADKTVDKNAGKNADKTVDKNAGKNADKTVDKNAGKNADKTVEKKAGKKSALMEEAAAAILEAKKSIPEEELDSFLAQAYETIDDIPQAETHLLAWQKKNPDSMNLRRMTATFYAAHRMPEKAREQIELILSHKPAAEDAAVVANRAWARRALAEMLARRGNTADVQKAIELVEQNNPDGRGASPADLRLIAGILSTRSDIKSLERAIQLYEKLADQQMLDSRERLALSVLYDRAGNWQKAHEEIMSLWVRLPKSPAVLGTLIQMLLEHDEVGKIDKLMEKLEEAAPVTTPAGVITVKLKTLWLSKQKKVEEATEFLESLVSEPIEPDQVARLGMVAGMLEELKDESDAEKYMRQWYEADPTQVLALATFLGRHGKLDEAFALLEKAREKQPLPGVCAAGVEIVRRNSDQPATEEKKKLEQWVLDAIGEAKDPANTVRLKLLLVEIQDLQGRFGDSIKLYRDLLAGSDGSDMNDQQRAIVQNNLAFMLVTRGTGKNVAEAQALVDKAVEQLGPIAGVLDTRGLVRLADGNAELALADFKTAVTESPTAVNFFHLALAQEKLGNVAAVTEAFEKAEELKLDSKLLSPGEKKDYNRLHKNLAKPKKG